MKVKVQWCTMLIVLACVLTVPKRAHEQVKVNENNQNSLSDKDVEVTDTNSDKDSNIPDDPDEQG